MTPPDGHPARAPRSSTRGIPRAPPRRGSSARRAPTTRRWRCCTSPPRSSFLALAGRRVRADADPADRAREHDHPARDLQPPAVSASGVSFAVLFCVPLVLGLIGYIGAAPDRRPRRRLPAPQPALVLALPGRRGHALRELPLRGARGRHARPAAAVEPRSSRPRNGADAWIAGVGLAILGFVCFAINLVVTLNRMRAPGIAWRRMPLFAWAATGDRLHRAAVVGPVMLAGARDADDRPPLRRRLLRRRRGRRAAALRAPLLHLLHRRLRDRAAGRRRRHLRDPADLRPQAALQPSRRHRRRSSRSRVLGPARLDAEHVHRRRSTPGFTIVAMAVAVALLVPIGTLFYNWIATMWGGALRAARGHAGTRCSRSRRCRSGSPASSPTR